MRLLVVVLVLSMSAVWVGADDPKPLDDGLYWLTEGEPIASLSLPSGTVAHIGGAYRPGIRKATVTSKSNRNDRYSVQLECEYGEAAKRRDYVLVVGGIASRRSGGGSSGTKALYWSFEVEGREQARAVAAFLGVTTRDRRHPGHQLLVEFAQHRDWHEGGAHEIEFTIENVGKQAVAFVQGGMYRGMRDGQFSFVAHGDPRKGGLPDIGNSVSFGGISVACVLEPGEVHRQRVDLRKWFDMKAGTYHVIGTYHMTYVDPTNHSQQTPIWIGFAAGQCHVTVDAAPTK